MAKRVGPRAGDAFRWARAEGARLADGVGRVEVWAPALLGGLGLLVLGALAPEVGVTLPAAAMSAERGRAYVTPLPLTRFPYRVRGSQVETPAVGRLVLLEDGFPAGRGDALHEAIRQEGSGAYSLWGEWLYLSASDGSDPRTNGRVYAVVGRAALHPTLDALAIVLLGLAGVGWARAAIRGPVARQPRAIMGAGRVAAGLGALGLLGCLATAALAPPRAGTLSSDAVESGRQRAYQASIPREHGWPRRAWFVDTDEDLAVREAGTALGPIEEDPGVVAVEGAGRYWFQGTRLVFSSSDGTDPRTNGRLYSWQLPVRVRGVAWLASVALLLAGAVLGFPALERLRPGLAPADGPERPPASGRRHRRAGVAVPMADTSSRRNLWGAVIAALSFCAAGSVWVASARYGMGASPDSVAYLSAADNVARGNGLVLYDGRPLVAWPPLYPLLLAGPSALGLDMTASARLMGMASFGALVAVCGLWAWRQAGAGWVGALSAALVLLTPPLQTISRMAWSETLFAILAVLFLWQAAREIGRDRLPGVASLGLLGGLACVTRHIGVTLLLTGGLVLLLDRSSPIARRLARTATLALVALPLPVAWLVRNQLVTGTVAGHRSAAGATLEQNLLRTGRVMKGWLLPMGVGDLVPDVLAAGLLGVALAAVVAVQARHYVGDRRPGVAALSGGSETVLFLFICVYLVAQIAVSTRINIDPLDNRLLSPVAAPAVLLLAMGIARWIAGRRRAAPPGPRRGPAIILAGSLTLYLLGAAAETVQAQARAWHRGAGGYNSVPYRTSRVLTWVIGQGPAGLWFSNVSDALYLLGGRPAQLSPGRPLGPGGIAWLNRRLADSRCYLVWYRPNSRSYLLSPEELSRHVRLEMVRTFDDGDVYRMLPRSTGP